MEKTMDIKLNKSNILHIMPGKGWYIDDCTTTCPELLMNGMITRESTKIDILNNPCIYVMSACNGTCQYCYQNSHLSRPTHNLTFDEIKEFVTKLNKYQDNNAPKSIELFGGEPLLRKDICEIITLLKQFGYTIMIATNGTLPILKNYQFLNLIKKNVHIRISLDGHTPELHEKYRTKDSFKKIIENIRFLRNAGIDVSVKSIITDHNFPYIENILRFLRDELHVQHWNYNVLYKLEVCQENDIKTSITHYEMVKELCKDKYYPFLPMFKQTPFTQMLTSVYVKHTKRYRRMYIFLNYDKKIYMNDQLIVPEYSIGDCSDFDLPFENFICKYETEKAACANCYVKDYCYLGNYGELYKEDPTLKSEFPTCDYLRNSIIHLMSQKNKGIKMLKKIYS